MFDDPTRLEFPRGGVTVLPFNCDPAPLCCMASGPGGRALHVLIDTGTDPSAMDLRLARRLSLELGGSGLGQGAASDAVPFTEAVLPWLRLGDLTIRNLFAPAVDLSGLPFPVDVVLGYSVLRQVALRLDYRRRRMTLAHFDVSPPALSPRGAELPLTFFEHFPALRDIVVDGLRIPLATLDTGSNSGLTLGPDLALALGLEPGAGGVSLVRGEGFGGGGTVVQRRSRELRIGPFCLPDVDLDAHLGRTGDLGRAGRANIGNRLLASFACVGLDYERRMLILEPE
ncbi:MAG: retropepsin-like aspartic protease [Roseiflexaceae bacterium]